MDYDLEKTMAPGAGCDDPRNISEARRAKEAFTDRLETSRLETSQPAGQLGRARRDPLDELFRYHPPTPQQLPKYSAINQAAKNFAEVIRANCPTYMRQFDQAIDAIMQARMLANASVALEGKI